MVGKERRKNALHPDGMESNTHLEIIKRLIDQISMDEKRILGNYIKMTQSNRKQDLLRVK